MALAQQVQKFADITPKWLDAVIIGGSAALSWLQPLAALVAIVWGCLQIYDWIMKRRKSKEAK